MDKKLFNTRHNLYKKYPAIFWEVSIFTMLFAIALVALDVFVPGLIVLTISFLFFPIFYSAFVTLFTIKFGGTVSLKSTFVISRTYYKPASFGCFKLLKNFLLAFLADIVASLIFLFVFYKVFEGVYGSAFIEALESMYELTLGGERTPTVLAVDNPVNLYITVTSAASFIVGSLIFILGVSFNSPVIYLCASMPNGRASFNNSIFSFFVKQNRKNYTGDFFALNWPLFVLYLLGSVSGFLLVMLTDISIDLLTPISLICGLIFITPFIPFFIANSEALFTKYDKEIKKASKDMTLGVLRNIKNQGKMSEEDLKKVNDILNGKIEEEENKKEP